MRIRDIAWVWGCPTRRDATGRRVHNFKVWKRDKWGQMRYRCSVCRITCTDEKDVRPR